MPRKPTIQAKSAINYFVGLDTALEAKVDDIVRHVQGMKPASLLYPMPFVPFRANTRYNLSDVCIVIVMFFAAAVQRGEVDPEQLRRYQKEYELIRNAPMRTFVANPALLEPHIAAIDSYLTANDIVIRPVYKNDPNRKAIITIAILYTHNSIFK